MKTYVYITESLISRFNSESRYNLINAKTREIYLQNTTTDEIKKYIEDNDFVIIAGNYYL